MKTIIIIMKMHMKACESYDDEFPYYNASVSATICGLTDYEITLFLSLLSKTTIASL